MKLQRILTGLLVIFLLACPITAQAETKDDVAQAIINACTYGEEADLAGYMFSANAAEELFYSLYDEGRLPWYAERSYSCRYNTETNTIVSFEPKLLVTNQYDRTRYEQRLAEALAACALPGMTPVQLALSVHDWLIVNCTYDETLEKKTGYDLLVNGTTVCAGYAAAYRDLMLRLGIPCLLVTSEAMNHGWNLVQLDGQWYHVDLTWDDPSPDSYGQVRHDYFLLTDEEISSGDDPHYNWDVTIPCTDTRFSNAYWRDTLGQICFADSNTSYFVRHKDWNNYLYAREEATGTERLLYTEKESYVNLGRGKYCYYHGSLSLWNGRLYYNRQDQLLSMDLNGKNSRTVYSHNTRKNQNYIYSCYVTNDTAFIAFADHDGNKNGGTVSLTATGYHTHSYTQSVVTPACETQGYTLSACSCGLTAKSLPTAPLGHSYTETSGKKANFFAEGWSDLKCDSCGYETTEYYPQIDLVGWMEDNRKVLLSVGILLFLIPKLLKKKVPT